MPFSRSDIQLAATIGQVLLSRQHRLATAESCTGGLVSALITEIAGSSQWFECGFVTYSNQAKQQMLGIANEVLLEYGAVSQQVAGLMAEQALTQSNADVALSITGIAGPEGGSDEKPVGTVWFGWKFTNPDNSTVHTQRQGFSGSRHEIRLQAVRFALQGIINHYR